MLLLIKKGKYNAKFLEGKSTDYFKKLKNPDLGEILSIIFE